MNKGLKVILSEMNSLANQVHESKPDLVDGKRSIIENKAANLNENSDQTLTVESLPEKENRGLKEQNNGLRDGISYL